ncbi:MAG: PKD domain-containing protein, partial [Anaerolineales bacterium]|nr:PKD domain-containing protein [Anaerolineales bacterium]
PNPETYPCFAGPMFTPFGFSGGGVAANFTVSPTVVNFPETAVFTNTTTTTNNVPVNYSWDFGDGQTAVTSSANFEVSYLTNGVFTPTLTADAFAWGMDTAVGPAITVNVENDFLPWMERP